MGSVRLPGDARVTSPLLGREKDSYDLPRPRRRCSRTLFIVAVLAAPITLILAFTAPIPVALEPYADQIRAPLVRTGRFAAAGLVGSGAGSMDEDEDRARAPVDGLPSDGEGPSPNVQETGDDEVTRRPPAVLASEGEEADDMEQAAPINDEDDFLSMEDVLPRIRYSKEDRHLRRYNWTTPKVHSSLSRMLEELTPAQNETRQWLIKSRTRTQRGTGIGLGADDPPRMIRPAPALPAHPLPPSEHKGPGIFVDGSLAKYNDLVEEWRTGEPVQVCEKGAWEDEYAQMHAEMLSGEREASLMEYVCHQGEYCGGFADRILGMTTSFLYSILTKRAFSIRWQQPAPIDLFFDSPSIDWSRPFYNETDTPLAPVYSNKTLIKRRKLLNAHNWEPEEVDEFMPKFVARYENSKRTPWLQIEFNRGVVMRSWSYRPIKPLVDAIGLKAQTAYSCLLNYLFRPKPAVLAFISQYTSFFALPENFVIGIQIRTGDLSMWADYKDAVNTVSVHSQYFTCADAVARKYAHPSQKVVYYLITDSHKLEREALRRFGDRVVVTGLKQAHVEIKTDRSKGLSAIKLAADGFMRTIAESWIFAGTDFQILTSRSGFGKIPTWLRGREGTTISLFNEYTDPEYTNMYKVMHNGRLPPPIDCSKPEALSSFSQLAQDWSLG
ncbi:hypothetical protein Rhopal_000718-T1 [Rhodotorula paludigena]|uniref:Proteophosphoglycan ppg4 n=1 Tax=Rhodotorula paludigena TaxID=86838 RepID=A0AAV5GCF6_9BASI|nr:hypothetical protein Rhopal_000718-T1 [Rhodotorula paludigena]